MRLSWICSVGFLVILNLGEICGQESVDEYGAPAAPVEVYQPEEAAEPVPPEAPVPAPAPEAPEVPEYLTTSDPESQDSAPADPAPAEPAPETPEETRSSDDSESPETAPQAGFLTFKSLFSNSGFSLPKPTLDLEPTEFSRNSAADAMSFDITRPELDLEPFEISGFGDESAGETTLLRKRRQVSAEFPSIFTFSKSSPPFTILFPEPDLEPGLSSSYFFPDPTLAITKPPRTDQSPLSNEIEDPGVNKPKRQAAVHNFIPGSRNSFRPSSQSTVKRLKLRDLVRPVRQRPFLPNRPRPIRPPPRYPPFDPFNTTYLPLPGPSSPHFALPINADNPHMRPGGTNRVRFVRPIRQVSGRRGRGLGGVRPGPVGLVLPGMRSAPRNVGRKAEDLFGFTSSEKFLKVNINKQLKNYLPK